MTTIDCSDCYLAIEIGDGVKRELVRYFSSFIAGRLGALDAPITESGRGAIDRDAWRLAGAVLNDVGGELNGTLDEDLLKEDPQRGAQNILAAAIGAAVAAIEQRYLSDELCGLEPLAARIAQASA